MSHIRSFVRFWWGFVVGDDWRIAAVVAAALGVTWVLDQRGSDVWWFLPLAIVLALGGSLRHEVRRQVRSSRGDADQRPRPS